MYATRTTFAATTAVMAAKVELPMDAKQVRRETRGGRSACAKTHDARTVPYVLLRCEIRRDWDDAEGETEDDKLEKYSRAADGTPRGWEKSQERDGLLPLLNSLCTYLCRNTSRAHPSLNMFCV